tara:strand:+ start:4823 stop:5029 length:207 start_codon:yes stop_codon:yes gene_type:complete
MKTNLKMVDENFEKEKKSKIICSALEWKNMDREEALQKECQERKKLEKPLGKNNKYVWVGIGLATKRS